MSAQEWNARYAQATYRYGQRPNDFLREQALLLKPCSRVLCLGDGEGRNGVWLAGQGHLVTTVDWSRGGVEKSRALASRRNVVVDAQVCDLAEWLSSPDVTGPWDALVLIFPHFPSALRQQVVTALTPQMTPKGLLILEEFTPGQLTLGTGGPDEESVLLTRTRVLSEWAQWRLDIRLVERRLSEGSAHRGLASVIQVLGQVLEVSS